MGVGLSKVLNLVDVECGVVMVQWLMKEIQDGGGGRERDYQNEGDAEGFAGV
jgi:hypothetical protein